MGLFSNIWNTITGFFKKEVPVVENAFSVAVKAVNIIKTLLGTATAQTIEAILEAFAPGVATAVFTALNTFFIDFGVITADVNKSAAQLSADGLNAASKLTGDSKTLILSNVATIIGHAVSTANNGGSTLQQAIVAIPVVHNPTVLDNVGSQVSANPPLPAENQVSAAQVESEATPTTDQLNEGIS
jgi:hypothetical protein